MNIQTNGLEGWNIREMESLLALPAKASRFPSSLRDSAGAPNEILPGRPSAKYFWLQKFMNFSLPCSRRTRTSPLVGEGTKRESQHCRRCDRWKREEWMDALDGAELKISNLSLDSCCLPARFALKTRSKNIFHWLIHLRAGAFFEKKRQNYAFCCSWCPSVTKLRPAGCCKSVLIKLDDHSERVLCDTRPGAEKDW